MIKDTDLISVRNRKNGRTGYTLDNNFHRNFNYQETLLVPFEELRRLSYAPGGQFILDNYLVIENKEALEALNMTVEPEYFYTESQIRELLFENNNIDAFKDFLDFAPAGCLDLAKKIAVEEKIPDVRKRDLLSEKTGLNINNAIMVNEIMKDEDETPAENGKQRRVQVEDKKAEDQAASEQPTRRVAPQHKVVSSTK